MELSNARLLFHPDGKLEALHLAGYPNLLHEYPHAFDLGGKLFRPAGWDECFPTIDPIPGSDVMGDLVGLHPQLVQRAGVISQTWITARFEAQRTFEQPDEHSLRVRFRAANHSGQPLEFLWASHALFSTQSLFTCQADGGLRFDDFRPDGSVIKLFHPNHGPVELVYPDFRAILTTDQPWWGVWLNRGGWPEDSPHQPFCCLGVEATNAAAEQPAGAWLQPGAVFEGQVTLTIR